MAFRIRLSGLPRIMTFLVRLGVAGLALACALIVFALVVGDASSDSDISEYVIQYDTLTCDELTYSYTFNLAVVRDIMRYYDGCVDYADSPASVGANDMLACRFIREHGLFVQGIINDIADVYNIKCATK